MLLRFCFISFFVLLISACTTAPKKPQPLDPNITQRLKSMPLPSKLPIPVENVKNRHLKDTWGASRSSGRTHEGIDILAPKGTKVYSTTDGVVGSMRNNNLGGKVIWILGPSNIVKLLYYSYKIRKKLEITHRLSRSTILYAYV